MSILYLHKQGGQLAALFVYQNGLLITSAGEKSGTLLSAPR